jgi:hypothetical protein
MCFSDLVTVSSSIEKRPQDEHVKRSLEEPDPLLGLLRHGRHSTPKVAMAVDTRLWMEPCGLPDAIRPLVVLSSSLAVYLGTTGRIKALA